MSEIPLGALLKTNCVSRIYAAVNDSLDESFFRESPIEGESGDTSKYKLIEELGHGSFSTVHLVENRETGTMHAMKIVGAEFTNVAFEEIRALKHLQGSDLIIEYVEALRTQSGDVAIVMPLLDSDVSLYDIVSTMRHRDVVHYMRQLLEGLNFCHSRGIIHGDVKPKNLMINVGTRMLTVIDFGCAQWYRPSVDKNTNIGSCHWMAPELILKCMRYTYAVDVWSAGCIFASLLFRKMPFFDGEYAEDQMKKYVEVVGSEELEKFASTFGVFLDAQLLSYVGGCDRSSWKKFRGDSHFLTNLATDLLNRIIIFDYDLRCTAEEALTHDYFTSKLCGCLRCK